MKLYPYKIIRTNPRCETIIEAITTTNNTEIIQVEKAQPGVLIDNYLVNIINIMETQIEMQILCVTPIEIASEDIYESSIQKEEKKEEIKTIISRTTYRKYIKIKAFKC